MRLGQTDRLPRRLLGQTGLSVSCVGLGSNGLLRTHGQSTAIEVIQKAFSLGINFYDATPASASNEEYLGTGLVGVRNQVVIASKTHHRSYDASMRLLEQSLKRLRTDYLDVWQIQDLRSSSQLEQIFEHQGAVAALRKVREEGIARAVGITGRIDAATLAEASRRFDWDTMGFSVNPIDDRPAFIFKQADSEMEFPQPGMIAQNVTADGRLVNLGLLTHAECVAYALSHQEYSTVLVDVDSADELHEIELHLLDFEPSSPRMLRSIEQRMKRRCPLLLGD